MKQKILLISKSSSTSVSIRSYLRSIFGKYLEVDAFLAGEAGKEQVEAADLVVFASRSAEKATREFLTPSVHYLLCSRTFNHTYLSRIFSIPPNSDVYLVNDCQNTAERSIQMLDSLGITQYHFIPYYPECTEVDYSIQYAVTPGEARYVPSHIQKTVDVGARITDISTISEIASFFKLPMKLVDNVTANYVNSFVQMLKISNHQLSQATNIKFLMQSVISNINTGLCILDSNGMIVMVNQPFIEAMEIPKRHLLGNSVCDMVPEIGQRLAQTKETDPLVVERGGVSYRLMFQEMEDTNHEKKVLIHLSGTGQGGEAGNAKKNRGGAFDRAIYNFHDFKTIHPPLLSMLETARRLSLTDYNLLIQGEMGTGREVLAQAIHNNSKYSQGPFLRLSLGMLTEEQICARFLGTPQGSPGIFKEAAGGTVYLKGIQHLTEKAQRVLTGLLAERPETRLICAADCDVYGLCLEGRFRLDLFYALNEVSLSTLPLRKRPEDIPLLFEYFMRNIYGNQISGWEQMCSEGLRSWLLRYQWPGNGMELENLCKYFFCARTGARLTMGELPAYLQSQAVEEKLPPLEKQLLALIGKNPKIGRAKLWELLKENQVEVSEGKIRGMLQGLAEKGLIKMNRTRGGCELTEEGSLLL